MMVGSAEGRGWRKFAGGPLLSKSGNLFMASRKPRYSPKSKAEGTEAAAGERLQKVLAAAGIGSRRNCEELITTGRVEVDREVVTKLGTRVDAEKQEIRVDGEVLSVQRKVYFLLHKPKGVVCTNHDPSGRPRAVDMVPTKERLFTVGRLDASSEGLILVTNDGNLANRLAHPRYGVSKLYHAQVAGTPPPELLKSLEEGIYLAEGKVQVESAKIRKQLAKSAIIEIVLKEGKNREIRRMLAAKGHKVVRLVRVAMGPLKLSDMPVGAVRPLLQQEIKELYRAAAATPTGKPSRGKKRPAGAREGSKPRRPSGPDADRSGKGKSRFGKPAARRPAPAARPAFPRTGDDDAPAGPKFGTVIGGGEESAAKPPRGGARGNFRRQKRRPPRG